MNVPDRDQGAVSGLPHSLFQTIVPSLFPIGINQVMESMEALGQEVQRLRTAAGLSQVELALLAGVGRRFLGELERGAKGSLRIDKVDRVLRVLGRRVGVVSLGPAPDDHVLGGDLPSGAQAELPAAVREEPDPDRKPEHDERD